RSPGACGKLHRMWPWIPAFAGMTRAVRCTLGDRWDDLVQPLRIRRQIQEGVAIADLARPLHRRRIEARRPTQLLRLPRRAGVGQDLAQEFRGERDLPDRLADLLPIP